MFRESAYKQYLERKYAEYLATRSPELIIDSLLPISPQLDWWHDAIVYQICLRSFKDSNGDGIGDIQGLISRLDYLQGMGITVIWLTPIYASPMKDFGYDITDYKSIHPDYGTFKDFYELISEAEQCSIKVIMDLVPNHTSEEHEWFLKSVARDEEFDEYYVWADGHKDENGERTPPNNWQSVFHGSAWTWHEGRGQYYLHQFSKHQPDLNFRNPDVVAMMDTVFYFWLNKGVLGFHVDSINYLYETPDFSDEPVSHLTGDKSSYQYTKHVFTKDLPEVYGLVEHWRRLLYEYRKIQGGHKRLLMTEAADTDVKNLMNYYGSTEGARGAHLPFNNIYKELDDNSDAHDFVFHIQKWMIYKPRDCLATWIFGNPNTSRMATRYGHTRLDAMLILQMTLPGVAIFYNGDELGMEDHRDISWEDTKDVLALMAGKDKYKKVSRDFARTPFQWDDTKNAGFSTADKTWLPVHPNYEEVNFDIQNDQQRSHYKLFRSLSFMRKTQTLQRGDFRIEVLNKDVFGFKRAHQSHDPMMTVINVSRFSHAVSVAEFFPKVVFLSVVAAGSKQTRYLPGDTLKPTSNLTLDAYEAIVLQGGALSVSLSAERRALIRTLIKSANIILVGLLMYKLWNNKWTKLNFYKEAKF